MNIQEIRQKYPQYSDLSDQELATSLHTKFYADMPFDDFSNRIGLPKTQAVQPKSNPTGFQELRASVPGRIAQGMADTGIGALQLISKIPGVDPMARLAERQQESMTFKGLQVPEGLRFSKGIDDAVRNNEQQYQQARQATGSEGFDAARLIGNVASPINLAIASRIQQAATLLGKMGVSGLTGASTSALQPVTQGDFLTEKGKQVATGGVAGAATPLLGGMLARVIRPNTSKQVLNLLDEGVTPTPGQILGGRAQVLEDKATSLPIIGDAIQSARRKSLNDFGRAAYQRALAPINGKVPKDLGREGIANVRQQIGDAYDDLLPKLSFKADSKFANDISQLRSLASQLPEQQAKQFEKVLSTQVQGKMTPQGLMSGERLKEVESELGRVARGYAGDASFDNRQLGEAINQVRQLIRENLTRTNPKYAADLKKINTAYANYSRLRDAASRQGSTDGMFTPSQLSAAVRSQDKTVGKRAFSEGTALMQDLSDAGKNVLASKYPDSGSIGRLGLGALALGGGYYLNPKTLAVAGLASLPYLPGGRQTAAMLLARRPEAAGLLSENVRKSVPYLTPAAGLLANQFVNSTP